MKLMEDLEYVSVAETKAKLSEKLKSVESKGRRFAVTSHGKPKAVIMGYKDYIALTEKSSPSPEKEIPFEMSKKELGRRKSVIESVASLFDEKKLTRKGQKGYKREAVRKMEEILCNRPLSIEDLIVDRLCAFKYLKSTVDGVNALIMIELGTGDKQRIENRAREEDVLDALDYVEDSLQTIIRKKLTSAQASDLLASFHRRK